MRGRQDYWFCTVEGCNRKHSAKGLCSMHQKRLRRNGILESLSDPEVRFHNNFIPVTKTGCWMWTGYVMKGGYGRMGFNGNIMLAQRFSWELHYGPIPEGMDVCHHCDTPPCVNPDHLFLGTQKDNNYDSVEKGRNRGAPGESNGSSKLKNKNVLAIRKLKGKGLSQVRVGEMFNISRVVVSGIWRNKAWQHVKEGECIALKR